MENVKIKTSASHRFNQTVKNSVCSLNFDGKGETHVPIIFVKRLLENDSTLTIEDTDYEKKLDLFKQTYGKTVEDYLSELSDFPEAPTSETYQQLLMRERDEKISLLTQLQEVKDRLSTFEAGNVTKKTEEDLSISVGKNQKLEKDIEQLQATIVEKDQLLVEKDKVITSLETKIKELSKAGDENPQEKGLKEDLTEKEPGSDDVTREKLSSYTVPQLQKIAKDSNLPESEWVSLRKALLVDYLISKTE